MGCWTKCIGGETAACKQCVADSCTPALKTCSGLTPPSLALSFGSQGGACTNDADQQVWTSKGEANFNSDMSDCGHSSLGNKGKATSCMKGKEGYSDGCAACFGDTISCTASKCWTKCIGGETAACKQCVADSCTPALKTCSGLTPPSFAIELGSTGGACTNDADQQVWTSKGEANFNSDMSACGHSSSGDANKATTCMMGKEGYSQTCAACFGATI